MSNITFKAQIEIDTERGVMYVHNAETRKKIGASIAPTVIRISRLPKHFDITKYMFDIDYYDHIIALCVTQKLRVVDCNE